ncbi:STAS domain-containing protein [Streptomyces sp. NPDC057680]|uniref:STAS domain-containing protein n=1 Tax=Streptomyces sp. NPDC057680 TaxID=3346208 RepID=UPI0036CE53F2
MTHAEDEATTPRPAGAPQAAVMRVSGDLDLHHVEEVRSTLLDAIAEAPPGAEVTIDLTYSSFCDSAGLEALLTARRRALDSGRTLRLGAPSHQLLRLMAITNTAGLFAMGAAPRQDGSGA